MWKDAAQVKRTDSKEASDALRPGWYLVNVNGETTTVEITKDSDLSKVPRGRLWGPLSRDLLPGESWFSARFDLLIQE